jgi:hypothetical protein
LFIQDFWISSHGKIYVCGVFVQSQKWISDTSSYQKDGMFVFDSFLEKRDMRIKIFEIVEKQQNFKI